MNLLAGVQLSKFCSILASAVTCSPIGSSCVRKKHSIFFKNQNRSILIWNQWLLEPTLDTHQKKR
ncbi:hypothetical protein BpHYR1_019139 [Brachionus plicatilis]|uniref:Secreted protein n=1 Tax=Brachionus plicatilis TaxID=10195 RepID=A0A3M7PR41_BRAPC|nr:hypothetical protein BpHYR1_019139 [Brachionus plicatilis]